VKGYDVVTSEGDVIGRAAAVSGEFLLVQQGRLRRSTRPIPLEFVHPDDELRCVRITVPREVLKDAPRVGEGFDRAAAARYYGLASAEPGETGRG
jgi:hypothetical protein